MAPSDILPIRNSTDDVAHVYLRIAAESDKTVSGHERQTRLEALTFLLLRTYTFDIEERLGHFGACAKNTHVSWLIPIESPGQDIQATMADSLQAGG